MKGNKKAFTLIEVLVVIAIIGVMAGLLLPVIRGVRDKGNEAGCQRNQRQLVTAALLYAEEHDNMIPDVSDLGAYLDDESVFTCPSDKRPNLGINNSSYKAFELTPETLLPSDNNNGSLANTAIYVESDKIAERADIKLGVGGEETDLSFRHGNGNRVVISFADGHVESIHESELSSIWRFIPTSVGGRR